MQDARNVSTAALAYLGDCVMELLVRSRLVSEGFSSSKALNRQALEFVSAPAQAAAMTRIAPLLSEEEQIVFRRGRNLPHANTPRNATPAEYRSATGMEALFGYLYLSERKERLNSLFEAAFGALPSSFEERKEI